MTFFSSIHDSNLLFVYTYTHDIYYRVISKLFFPIDNIDFAWKFQHKIKESIDFKFENFFQIYFSNAFWINYLTIFKSLIWLFIFINVLCFASNFFFNFSSEIQRPAFLQLNWGLRSVNFYFLIIVYFSNMY